MNYEIIKNNYEIIKNNTGGIQKVNKENGKTIASVGTGFDMKISFTLVCTDYISGEYPEGLVDERIKDIIAMNEENYSDIKVESLDIKQDDYRRENVYMGTVTVNMSMKWTGNDVGNLEPFRLI